MDKDEEEVRKMLEEYMAFVEERRRAGDPDFNFAVPEYEELRETEDGRFYIAKLTE